MTRYIPNPSDSGQVFRNDYEEVRRLHQTASLFADHDIDPLSSLGVRFRRMLVSPPGVLGPVLHIIRQDAELQAASVVRPPVHHQAG